jgi:hypothetical protein
MTEVIALSNEALAFLLGTVLNLVAVFIVVRFIYYPVSQNKGYVFSYLAFNTVVYFMLRALTSVELSLGFGFGLFAIFSVIRYRTEAVPIREMTYLFTVIGLAVMNSFLRSSGAFFQIGVANIIIIAVLMMLEKEWGFRFESNINIRYENIKLITPENKTLLLADLCKRTGLPITRVELGRIDFLRDIVDVQAYYDPTALKHQSEVAVEPKPTRERIEEMDSRQSLLPRRNGDIVSGSIGKEDI